MGITNVLACASQRNGVKTFLRGMIFDRVLPQNNESVSLSLIEHHNLRSSYHLRKRYCPRASLCKLVYANYCQTPFVPNAFTGNRKSRLQ